MRLLTYQIRTGIVFSLMLVFIVIVAVALYADTPQMLGSIVYFHCQYISLILGLLLYNYFSHFLNWQYYLKCLAVKITWTKSLLIFFSGLSMDITPGKVGELLKCYLLKRAAAEPISRTSPVVVAERLSDDLSMLLLAATGLVLYHFGYALLLFLLVAGLIVIILSQNRRLLLSILSFGERLPVLAHIAHLLREFYKNAYNLLQWRPLLLAVSISFISWLGECAALYFVFTGLGITPSLDLFIKAAFILSVSTLVGSVSGLPGGLGTVAGTILGLTRLLVTASTILGGAATLLICLSTLWFGLLLGIIALLILSSAQHRDFSTRHKNDLEHQQNIGQCDWRDILVQMTKRSCYGRKKKKIQPKKHSRVSHLPNYSLVQVDGNSK